MRFPLTALFLLVVGNCFSQSASDYYSQAKELQKQKQFDRAILLIDKALSVDSVNLEYLEKKGDCLIELEKYQEAYDVYSKAISFYPKVSSLYDSRGNILLTNGMFDQAIEEFSIAIAFSENDTVKRYSLSNRGAAKSHKRDFEGAYVDLKKAYDMDSSDLAVLTNLGAVCDEIGKGEEAFKYLLKAIQIDPKFIGGYANLGFKYQEMGQHKKAIEYYNKVLELDPKEALGYSNRGFNKLKLGDPIGGLADINKSIELYSGNSYAYKVRALIYIALKETAKACADIQTSLDKGYTTMYGDEAMKLQNKHCKK